jgi:hypothetical protein
MSNRKESKKPLRLPIYTQGSAPRRRVPIVEVADRMHCRKTLVGKE